VTSGHRLLYPLVFVAGATTMSTEMSASRLLAPFFGASILVWANIIGLILIYLCAGYFIGGRIADRHPSMAYLARLMLIAAAAIAATPFIASPLLDRAVTAFADASVGAFLGSFFASMLIFSVPITLLGMASPFAVRLGVTRVEQAGEVAGRMYALSTAGSILGTFLPVVVLIPSLGTRRTMLASAAVLALTAVPALGRRYLLAPVAIGVLALVPPGLVKPGHGVVFETESPYQFIQVVQQSDGTRILHLNEGWADHSIWRKHRVLTGGYWDQFLLAPALHGGAFRRLAMIGYAGGTVGRAYGTYWPAVDIQGIELDPDVTSAGRRYFGLGDNPRVRVATADGRTYLEQHAGRYDAIFLDAFRQPYIPFYLTTQEFWSLAVSRLNPGGMVMANVGRVPGDDRLPDAIGGTMATRFASVYRWPVGDFNVIVAGFTRSVTRDQLLARLEALPPSLAPARADALALRPVAPVDDPLTDDHAPVEWLTDQMIVRYAAAGGTGK
jgi:predicted membrane-bound spermidine synthase